MLQEPDQLCSIACGNRGGACFHIRDSVRIGHRRLGDSPLNSMCKWRRKRLQNEAFAGINHWVTINVVISGEQFLRVQNAVPTLDKVSVDLTVVLGTTSMPVHQVMRLSRGAIIELDATEQDEVKVLANNLPVASGVVVVNRNRIAVEVKQMLPRSANQR